MLDAEALLPAWFVWSGTRCAVNPPMRRSPVGLLVLVASLGFSCAYGRNGLPGRGSGEGDGGSATTNPENEHEPDPGSPDPGGGDTTNPDGDGDATTTTDNNPDGDGDPSTGATTTGDTGETSDPGTTGGGDPFQCAHDPCSPGVALEATCDPCVSEACAADAFCCENEWDQQCVDQATACGCGGSPGGDPDPGGGSTCEHDVCLPGVALDAGCSECAGAVCAADDFCCTTEWDIYCTLQALVLCSECG